MDYKKVLRLHFVKRLSGCETIKHQWLKYNAVGIVDGKKPLSYRQYCRRYQKRLDSKKITFHMLDVLPT